MAARRVRPERTASTAWARDSARSKLRSGLAERVEREQERTHGLMIFARSARCTVNLARHRPSLSGTGAGYSHSIVDGGFDEMSRATRLTAGISLMIRLEIVSSRS